MIDFEVRYSGIKDRPIALRFAPTPKEWVIHYLTSDEALRISYALQGLVVPALPAYLSGPAETAGRPE